MVDDKTVSPQGRVGHLTANVSNNLLLQDIPNPQVQSTNCAALFAGDKHVHNMTLQYQEAHPKQPVGDEAVLRMAQNCDSFRRERKYIMTPVNEEEAEFPIAFSLLLYKETEMVERLLRAIYRPQNVYCIHVDQTSPKIVHDAMATIVRCFKNVFVASQVVDVQWGLFNQLKAELVCMEDLWKYTKWKYFINLTGQEFPLKTNLDIVKILKAYHGGNSIASSVNRYGMFILHLMFNHRLVLI
jgi:hypothetical protein